MSQQSQLSVKIFDDSVLILTKNPTNNGTNGYHNQLVVGTWLKLKLIMINDARVEDDL